MSTISVATIKSPEFINITSINPLISKCEIKVLYIGQNRNRSYITKEVATEMAQSLPGTPIVGYYSQNKEDFGDHGEQVVIDGDGVKFNCLTKPYGFVSLETKVWFQEFEETDDFGNKILREYLMCEGYLWTEQYEEAKKIIEEGRPHSMELDKNSLKGHWSTDNNSGLEFFIINDAIFSKLCILGEDVEPCFEGSAITAPEVSSHFTKDSKEFTQTLFTMLKELKELTYSLQDKGGTSMPKLENEDVIETKVEDSAAEPEVEQNENFSKTEDKVDLENHAENNSNIEEFKKNDDDSNNINDKEDDNDKNDDDDDDKEPKKNHSLEEKYALLEQELNDLKVSFNSLQEENKNLSEFKKQIENEQKDALIKSFYMLSDEDKKEVIENKAKYTLEEIESKLSVICVRKKVDFNLNKEEEDKDINIESLTTYNLNNVEADPLPAWLRAVENKRNENN